MRRLLMIFMMFACLELSVPGQAPAYIGPGAGLSAIGTVIALIGGILLAIVGFVWYPIKRFMGKRKEDISENNESP